MNRLLQASLAGLAVLAIGAGGALAHEEHHKRHHDGDDRSSEFENACYKNRENDQYVRYLASRQGDLTTRRERRKFDHPVQTTYTVHGKSTEVDRFIGIVDGAAIVGKHSGAVIKFTRDFLGVSFSDRSDCVSANEEVSVTPETWVCNLIIVDPANADDLRPDDGLTIFFDRVDIDETHQCSDFSIPRVNENNEPLL